MPNVFTNCIASMRRQALIKAVENKYNRLLIILISIYLFSPFLIEWQIGNFIVSIVFLGAITLVVHQVYYQKHIFKLYISLILIALIFQLIGAYLSSSNDYYLFFDLIARIITLAFLALSVYLIFRELFIVEQVTSDTIKGGICIYFLIGFFWASLYSAIHEFDPQSFSTTAESINRADLVYFSFTTLTTVGYGDIVPVSAIARVLANLEAIVGTIYPAVYLARLVALYK